VYFQQQAALPLHVTRVSHLSRHDFGLLIALNGALIVLLELPISAWTMRRPPRRMMAVGFLLVAIGFGVTGVAHTLPWLMVTVAIWTLGEMIGAPVGYAYVADIAPEHMRGRYQGLYGLCWASGTVSAPAIGAYLVTRNDAAFWAACGVLGAISAILVLAGRREPRVREPLMSIPEPVETGPGLKP